MSHFVIVEIAAGRERLSAVFTLVRLLPGVNPAMRVQTAARAEPLCAKVAHVRPFPRVDSDVSLQQAGPVKHLAARVTRQHRLRTTGGR